MFQYAIIFTILATSVGYAVWRIYEALRQAKDPCYGCSGCAQRDQKQRKATACDKKLNKKFGRTE